MLAVKNAIFAPRLSQGRIWFAMSVAIITDLLQLCLGPFGWLWVDQGLDVVAMALISAALGFHMLLLPTFVLEFIPMVDMLPTWTGCTAVVIMLRKRAQNQAAMPAEPSAPAPPPPIDISAEVTPLPPEIKIFK